MRLLVVEDNLQLLESSVELLSDEYEVDQAANGEDGLFLAQQAIHDLIILDVMLPVIDGFEILKKIRWITRLSSLPRAGAYGFPAGKRIRRSFFRCRIAELALPTRIFRRFLTAFIKGINPAQILRVQGLAYPLPS